jgi:phage-related minor tail protein
MAKEIENALKNAATAVAQYVKDAATMQVETRYVILEANGSANFEQAAPIARTVIKLDGDSETVVPMRRNEAGVLEVDTGLFEMHQQNVNTAIEYRARILNSLLSTLIVPGSTG